MSSVDIKEKFNYAIKYLKYSPKSVSINDLQKLDFYKYYKQATEGDNKGPQPSILNFREKAKWSAWNGLLGMKQETAMQEYLKLLNKHKPDWEKDAKILHIPA